MFREILLVVLVVSLVGVPVATADQTGATRSVSTEVEPGETVSVTLRITASNDIDGATYHDNFTDIATSVRWVAFDSTGQYGLLSRHADESGVEVRFADIQAGTTIRYTYEVTVAENVPSGPQRLIADGVFRADGRALGVWGETRVDVQGGTVHDEPVSTQELRDAIARWAGGELSTEELREMITTWAGT